MHVPRARVLLSRLRRQDGACVKEEGGKGGQAPVRLLRRGSGVLAWRGNLGGLQKDFSRSGTGTTAVSGFVSQLPAGEYRLLSL